MPRSISYGEVVQSLEPLSNWSRFFVHPFSGRVLWVLANYAPVHPNLLTTVSGLLGAGAAFMFLQGEAAGWYVGAGLYYLSFALDTIDGSLARLTGKTSALGAYLDVVVDFVRSAALCTALSVGVYLHTQDTSALYLGFGLLSVNLLHYFLGEVTTRVSGTRAAAVTDGTTGAIASRLRRLGIVPKPFGLHDLEALCFIIAPVAGYPYEGIVAGLILAGLSRLVSMGLFATRLRSMDRDRRR